MPAQFSKDQRVFLVLEYTKRRGRKGVQNEIIQEFNYKCAVPQKNQISHLIFNEFL